MDGWATQYCLLRWSRMRTGCLCTQEDLCASLWTPSAKLTTCLTKSSLHQVCLAREHVFVARFFKRFLLFGAGNTYGVDTGYGNFTGVVGGFELFRIFLSSNVSCWRWKMWRWEWYRGERWTSEEACSPSWRRERWTLNARWPKSQKICSLFASFQEVVDFSNGISVEENTILMKTPR